MYSHVRRDASERKSATEHQRPPQRQHSYGDRMSAGAAHGPLQSEYYPRRSVLPYAASRRSSEEQRHSMLPTEAFPQATDSSDSVSTLHAWSVWRTNINQSLASDLVGNKYSEIPVGPFHQQLLNPDDKGEDVYRYSTAINSGTSLHFSEYINYGIPRVRLRKDQPAESQDWVRRASDNNEGASNGFRGDSPRQQRGSDVSPGSAPQRRSTVQSMS